VIVKTAKELQEVAAKQCKITIEPVDTQEAIAMIKGPDALLVIWDVLQNIRKKLKYGEPPEDIAVALEEVRKDIYEQMEHRGITTDMIE